VGKGIRLLGATAPITDRQKGKTSKHPFPKSTESLKSFDLGLYFARSLNFGMHVRQISSYIQSLSFMIFINWEEF